MKEECSNMILEFFRFFLPELARQLSSHQIHQGTVSILFLRLAMAMHPIFDKKTHKFGFGHTSLLRVFWLNNITGDTQIDKPFFVWFFPIVGIKLISSLHTYLNSIKSYNLKQWRKPYKKRKKKHRFLLD